MMMKWLHNEKYWFLLFLTKTWRTDGPTDRRTDKASYRDAWTHLKIRIRLIKLTLSCNILMWQLTLHEHLSESLYYYYHITVQGMTYDSIWLHMTIPHWKWVSICGNPTRQSINRQNCSEKKLSLYKQTNKFSTCFLPSFTGYTNLWKATQMGTKWL